MTTGATALNCALYASYRERGKLRVRGTQTKRQLRGDKPDFQPDTIGDTGHYAHGRKELWLKSNGREQGLLPAHFIIKNPNRVLPNNFRKHAGIHWRIELSVKKMRVGKPNNLLSA